jgi:hypothetical protein
MKLILQIVIAQWIILMALYIRRYILKRWWIYKLYDYSIFLDSSRDPDRPWMPEPIYPGTQTVYVRILILDHKKAPAAHRLKAVFEFNYQRRIPDKSRAAVTKNHIAEYNKQPIWLDRKLKNKNPPPVPQ